MSAPLTPEQAAKLARVEAWRRSLCPACLGVGMRHYPATRVTGICTTCSGSGLRSALAGDDEHA